MKEARRLFWFFLLTIMACTLVGGLYGRRVTAATDIDAGALRGNLDAFAKIYALVQQNYADPVNPDHAIFGPEYSNTEGAIPAMLRTLDPHSNFFQPEDIRAAPRKPGRQVLRRGHADPDRSGQDGSMDDHRH